MKYEYELFEKLISEVSVNYHTLIDNVDSYLKYLLSETSNHQSYTLIHIKYKPNSFAIQKSITLNNYHPLATSIVPNQYELFQSDSNENHIAELLNHFNIPPDKVIGLYYSRLRNNATLFIKQSVAITEYNQTEIVYYAICHSLSQEVERIKSKIRELVFQSNSKNELEAYIHKNQHELVNLSYNILRLLSNEQKEKLYTPSLVFTKAEFLGLIYLKIEDILLFIEKNYPYYLDEKSHIPYRCQYFTSTDVLNKIKLVNTGLSRCSINTHLLRIISMPLQRLSSITIEDRITYRQLLYFTLYVDAFYNAIKASDEPLTEKDICTVLFSVNFNLLEYQGYNIANFQRVLKDMDSPYSKIDYLNHFLKECNQKYCPHGVAFDSKLPTIKELITNWIEEEILFLQKSLPQNQKPVATGLFTPTTEKVKIMSNLNVSQLACLYRLQVETKILNPENPSQLFKHINQSYFTKNAASISPESIKNKYYNVEYNTVESVKENVIEMLNVLKDWSTNR